MHGLCNNSTLLNATLQNLDHHLTHVCTCLLSLIYYIANTKNRYFRSDNRLIKRLLYTSERDQVVSPNHIRWAGYIQLLQLQVSYSVMYMCQNYENWLADWQ